MSILLNENVCVFCEKDFVNLIVFFEERSCIFFCLRIISFFFFCEYFLFLKYVFKLIMKYVL